MALEDSRESLKGTETFRGFGNRSMKEGVATNPFYRAERIVREESVDVNSH